MALPVWVPASSYGVATLTVANNRLARNVVSVCAPYYDAFRFPTIFNDYSGGTLIKNLGTHGAYAFFGTGHTSGNDNTTPLCIEGDVCDWVRLNDPSPVWGSGTDVTTQGNNAAASYNPYLTDPYTAAADFARFDPTAGTYPVDGQTAGCHSYGLLHEIFALPGDAARLAMIAVPAATFTHPSLHSVVAAHELRIGSLAQASSARKWRLVAKHPLPGSGAWTAPNGLGFAPSGASASMTPTNDATLPKLTGLNAPMCSVFDARRRRSFLVSRAPGKLRWFDWTTRRWWYGTSNMPSLDGDDPGSAWVLIDAPELTCAFFVYRSPAAGSNICIRVLDYVPEEPTWSANVSISANIAVRQDWSSAAWNPNKNLLAIGDLQGNNQAIAEVVVPPRDTLTSGSYVVTQRTLGAAVGAWRAPSGSSDNARGYGKMAWNQHSDCYAAWDITQGQPDILYRIRA